METDPTLLVSVSSEQETEVTKLASNQYRTVSEKPNLGYLFCGNKNAVWLTAVRTPRKENRSVPSYFQGPNVRENTLIEEMCVMEWGKIEAKHTSSFVTMGMFII